MIHDSLVTRFLSLYRQRKVDACHRGFAKGRAGRCQTGGQSLWCRLGPCRKIARITARHPGAQQTPCLSPQNSSAPLAEDIDPEVSSGPGCWLPASWPTPVPPHPLLHCFAACKIPQPELLGEETGRSSEEPHAICSRAPDRAGCPAWRSTHSPQQHGRGEAPLHACLSVPGRGVNWAGDPLTANPFQAPLPETDSQPVTPCSGPFSEVSCASYPWGRDVFGAVVE